MKRLLQTVVSLLVAGSVMYYIYRDFPFSSISHILLEQTDWLWIAAGMLAGAAAQFTRALRWRLLLRPLQIECPLRNLSGSIFMSFALSLVIPRIGEVSRCATLRKTDGVSFTRSIGTVVAERIADTLVLLALIAVVFCTQSRLVYDFFNTGNQPADTTRGSNLLWIIAAAALLACVGIGGIMILRRNQRFKAGCDKFKEGFLSVKHSGKPVLFVFYTALICFFNLLNLWLMFYAFPFTAQLGADAALLAFCMIAFAMVVPTPNGAGPWHYVVMTSLVFYGTDPTDAGTFALLVHALHTLTIIILGFVGMAIVRRSSINA